MFNWLKNISLMMLFLTFSVSSYADQCSDVFPSSPVSSSDYHLSELGSGGRNLSLGNSASLNITAGANTFYDSASLGNNVVINVTGSGTARLHFNGNVNISNGVDINKNGNPEDLVIYINGNLNVNNNAEVNALIYVNGNATIGTNGVFNGGFTANGDVDSGSGTNFIYDANAINYADYAGMCTGGGQTRPPPGLVCETYRDEFTFSSFNNNDGSVNWTSAWDEFDIDGAGARTGDVYITGRKLRITGKDDRTNNNWIARRASGAGYSSATLAFDYDPSSGLESDDRMLIEISTDGGNNYTILDTLQGMQNNPGVQRYSRDISSSLANDMMIRFRVFPDNGRGSCCFGPDSEYIDFDNVQLEVCSSTDTPLPAPIIEYRMDEVLWQDLAGEVTDSIGNSNSGQAKGGATTISNGAVCRAGQFDGNDDFIAVNDLSALQGTASLSFWIKTDQVGGSVTYLAPGISGTVDDVFWGWLDLSGNIGISVGNDSNAKSTTSVADEAWHHIVLTRNAATGAYQIFIDGALHRTGTTGSGVISRTFNSIGRIEDTGGTPEYFAGSLDEVLVFDQILTQTHVQQIYDNQRAGNNWDGSERVCPELILTPVAEYRLDETRWDGSIDEVVDSVGTFSGEAINTQPTDGKICNAADFRKANGSSDPDSAFDYIKLDGDVFANQGDFSISLWVNTAVTRSQSFVSGADNGSANELLFWFTNSSLFAPFLNNRANGSHRIPDFATGEWKHLVWVRSGTENCLYIDKVKAETSCVTLSDSNVTVEKNALVLAQEQDSVGGNFVGTQAFDGLMDEVLFFHSALSQAEIEQIHDLQDQGKNLDGTDRVCPTNTTAPIAEWHFDEPSWSGAANEIVDIQGSFNASVIDTGSGNVTNIADGKICRAGSIGSNNTETEQYAIDTGLDIDDDVGNKGSLSFWYRSAEIWGSNTERKALLSAGSQGSDNKYFFVTMETDGRLRFGLENTADADYRFSSSRYAFLPSEWVHVVATWDMSAQNMRLFVNGNEAINETIPSNIPIGELLSLYIGDNRSFYIAGSGRSSANGDFDEVLAFRDVLSADEIQSIYNNQNAGMNWDGTPRSCNSGVDHYSIEHDQTGVTCVLETITVAAKDSLGADIAAGEASMTIAATSAKGNWVSALSGTSSFSNLGNGTATFTFAPGASRAELQFAYPFLSGSSETFGFDVTDGAITERSGAAEASDDPNITFSLAGLRFIDTAGVERIPMQISGKNSDEGFGATNLYLQAVEATTADPSVCQTAIPAGTTLPVSMAVKCTNPSNCVSSSEFNVKSGTNNEQQLDLVNGTHTAVTMTFDAEAKAPIRLNYNDAGQVVLNATLTLSDPVTGTGAVLSGNSNQFVVRPFGFGFPRVYSATKANPGGDETGPDATTGFAAAGEPFTVEVNAYRYDAAESDSNGHPIAGADLTDNGITPNFAGAVTLTVDNTSFTPAAGTLGNFNGGTATIALGTANGAATDLTYDEVGSIHIIGSMSNYIQSGIDIESEQRKVGRFYPDHFVLTESGVEAQCSPFTYMQQPFKAVSYKLDARSVAGEVTENYDISLYPNTANVELSAEDSDNSVDLSGRLDSPPSFSGWAGGVIDRTASGALSDVIFQRDTGAAGLQDGPFAQLQLGLSLTSELDGRNFKSDDLNFNPGTSGACTSCTGIKLGGETEVRYGRVIMQSAHGPETEDLPVPFATEYWDGSAFVRNLDDSCTQISLGNISFNANPISSIAADRTVAVGDGSTLGGLNIDATNAQATAGDFSLIFSAPGAGSGGNDNTGYFPVGLTSIAQWLRYDWDQDSSANDSAVPDAIITFGRARGNDRMIFWQERYQ